ncbi:MAG: TlpA family protein disulfide reductase [Candidatus Eremiobacteraeota bacterium]|nr:TlpA family protein disulfide reductase [Candidatus Eremiobacteraeota bacterium]
MKSSTALSLVLLWAVLGTAGEAHRHAAAPDTGLARVRYNVAPPDFTFDLDSKAQRLSELRGKPVVLNFWATWCHVCVDEMSAFTQLQRTYGDRVAMLSISNEPAGIARGFLASRGVHLPLIEDSGHRIFDAYSVAPVPVTIVVSRNGTVEYVSVGSLDWPELQHAVERAFL